MAGEFESTINSSYSAQSRAERSVGEYSLAPKEAARLSSKERFWIPDVLNWKLITRTQALSRTFREWFIPRAETGAHEVGHEIVVKGNNDDVTFVSAEATDDYLGVTKWARNPGNSDARNAGNGIEASRGGEAAVNLLGIPATGCGSDRWMGRFWASMKARVAGGSAGGWLTHHISNANQLVSDAGATYIKQRGARLGLVGSFA